MDLSCILVNYHGSEDLPACIDSLKKSRDAGSLEILVVDNSEGDPGLDRVREQFPDVRFIINPRNVGFAKANNQGAREARGRFLLFVNPDVVASPDTLSLLRTYLEEHPAAAVAAPRVLDPGGSLQYSCRRFPTALSGLFNRYSLLTRLYPGNPFSRHYLMIDYDHIHTRAVDWVSGCCMMVRGEAFAAAGMFDENYFLFIEDVDLCRTFQTLGHQVVYLPAAEIVHRISSSNHRLPPRVIIKRHQGMQYYHRKFMEGNAVTRGILDFCITLRCGMQLVLNLFR